jgi:pyrroline-5-carboxylate reductase
MKITTKYKNKIKNVFYKQIMRLYFLNKFQQTENLSTTNKQQTNCQKITKQTKSNTSKYNNKTVYQQITFVLSNKPQNEK